MTASHGPELLRGTTCIITGASRGIGAAIARRFANAGATLGLIARTATDLEHLATELRASNTSGTTSATVAFAVADVAISSQVDRAAAQLRSQLGPAAVLVNNAGIVLRKPTAEITDHEWRLMTGVNLDGPFFVTRAFIADLRRQRGRIINIASIAGRTGTPLLAAYCATKHAVIGLTRSWAEEWRGEVVVNAICPGSVDTDMLRHGMPGATAAMSADDIATTALHLATEAPWAMTGSCVDVFG